MSRSASWCLLTLVLLANVLGTLCYSGAGPVDEFSRAYATPLGSFLHRVLDLLTLPIATREIADVRDVALLLPLGLAGLVLLSARPSTPPTSLALSRPLGWLVVCGGSVVMLAVLSAAANESIDLSWGWIVRTSAGLMWAVLLARHLDAWASRGVLIGLLLLSALSVALTIADRADSGFVHFRRPLGPITVTAALAAVWASAAGGYLLARLPDLGPWLRGRSAPDAERWSAAASSANPLAGWQPGRRIRVLLWPVVIAIVAVSAGYVLQQTGRRAAALGMAGAVLASLGLVLWLRAKRPLMKVVLLVLPVLSAAAAGVYVAGQLSSPIREVSGSLNLRLAYWRLSAELICEHPLLGCGPGRFVVAMTNRVSPMRAVSPHFFHGNLDLYAHNEWLQAAVELGVPAAVAWLALPLGLVWIAARRLREPAAAPGTHDRPAVLVACAAGVLALVLTDCGSIVLRTPILPPWYWTLLGLLAALARSEDTPLIPSRPDPPGLRRTPPGRTAIWGLAGLACLGVSIRELSRSVHERAAVEAGVFPMPTRLEADKTLSARYQAAVETLRRVVAREADAGAALPPWAALYLLMPGLHDTPAMYAQALLLNGRPNEARHVLEQTLQTGGNSTNPAANVLYARLRSDDAVEQMKCVQRALRIAALEGDLRDLAIQAAADPAGREWLERQLPEARRRAAGGSDQYAAASSVELLRIEAWLLERAGQIDSAAAEVRLAAEFYQRLEREGSRYRRGSEAETDAFYTLARLLYTADVGNHAEAWAAIQKAEYYAVLGIAHERRAVPEPQAGFVWGEVVPVEFPDRLCDLWRLSALLHLIAGQDRFLDGRVLSSLPAESRTIAGLHRAMAALARQAHADLSRLPPSQRPPHYAGLAEAVRRYEAASP